VHNLELIPGHTLPWNRDAYEMAFTGR
jgi:hypothetical protein